MNIYQISSLFWDIIDFSDRESCCVLLEEVAFKLQLASSLQSKLSHMSNDVLKADKAAFLTTAHTFFEYLSDTDFIPRSQRKNLQ